MNLIQENTNNIYHKYDFDINPNLNMINNRLFCTFTSLDNINELVNKIKSKYTILYNKIFILEILDKNEYIITYNIDSGNIDYIFENTILLHRKKEYNSLYSINALNELIKKLNNNILDNKYPINWDEYRNSILLTQNGEFHQLSTKLYKIFEI